MTVLKIKDKEYKIKFGYNCFCDTDLMERVSDMAMLMRDNNIEDEQAVSAYGKVKDLFRVVRDLLFVGFQKYNPVKSVQEIGDLLDDYKDEETEEERGLFQLFAILSEELMNEGFLGDLMSQEEEPEENQGPIAL